MFKYGSVKLFIVKLVFGLLILTFSIFHLGSLITYDNNDPGFNSFSDNVDVTQIENFFGIGGAYLSSYSMVLLGQLSFLVSVFFLINGFKFVFGFNNNLFIFKFISNLVGIIMLSASLSFYNFFNINFGITSIFISDLLFNFIENYLSNSILNFLFNIFLLLLGVYIILFSYSVKLKGFKHILKLLYILRFAKNILKIFTIFRILRINKKTTGLSNYTKRNEPTLNKKNLLGIKKSSNNFEKINQKIEKNSLKFSLPSVSLLIKSLNKKNFNKELNRFNDESSVKLEKTLSEYGVDGKVIGYKSGPIVTLFEFVPNAGIKSSKVIGLSEDISRAMSSYSARISSQPGKTSLGIEIPNSKRDGVLFGDLIEDDQFKAKNDSITLALGKDISGEKVFTDLEKMPHLLIAGTTGSGKSVGINTMILSILYKFKPNDCKLILIDPKMLELSVYEDIPHLLTPVVTDPKKAVFALKWVVREMENRYKLMSSVNVKNIESYNNKVLRTISSGRKLYREVQTGFDSDTKLPIIEKKEIPLEKMPFIVVVIDEMADLMMVAGKEVESLVQRLAQMARASGIHLITATQRPSVDVITGTIKANFPSRISYKVASKFDSRTILNEMGAEQLLGSGDMLLLENGGNIKRLHGGFVSETEVEKVVNSIKSQATFDYKKEISLSDADSLQKDSLDLVSDNKDELYNKAVDIIVKQQRVSTSFIQRYLQIGYNRAARIIEKMEEDGIITEANNAGKRHVLKKE